MSRVFIVSEPLRYDGDRRMWVRSMNLTPATVWGELVFLMPPGNEGPTDPAAAIAQLTKGLACFTADDYLLPVGHPLYIAWAGAIAARTTGGALNLLHWLPREKNYAVVRSQVFTSIERGAYSLISEPERT